MKAGVSTLGTHSLLSFMRYIEDFCREFRSIAAEQDEVCVVSSIEPIHHFANFFGLSQILQLFVQQHSSLLHASKHAPDCIGFKGAFETQRFL